MSASMYTILRLRAGLQSLLEQWRSNCRFIEQQRAMYAIWYQHFPDGTTPAIPPSMTITTATRRLIRMAYDSAQTSTILECREAYPTEDADIQEQRAHRMAMERAAMDVGVTYEDVRAVVEAC